MRDALKLLACQLMSMFWPHIQRPMFWRKLIRFDISFNWLTYECWARSGHRWFSIHFSFYLILCENYYYSPEFGCSPFVRGVLDLCRYSFWRDARRRTGRQSLCVHVNAQQTRLFFFLLSIVFCHVHGSSVLQLCLVSVSVCVCAFSEYTWLQRANCFSLYTYRFVSHSTYSFCAKLDFDRFI